MYSFSIEQLGTTAYVYLTPVDDDGETRSTGKVLSDFTLQFLDPDLDDITSETAITVEEYESNESTAETGSYRFAVPLPSTGEGNYSLKITDPFGNDHFATLMAYNFPPHTATGDSTAQVEIEAFQSNGDPVTTLSLDDCTLRIFNPSMEEVSDESTVAPTLTKMEDGRFQLEWDCSSEEGEWFMDVIHSSYFEGGQQALWRYQEPEDYSSPTIDDVDVSEDGLTVQVTLIKGEAPYVAAKLMATDGTVRDEDLRSGTGNLTLTRTVNENGIIVAYGCDEDGYPWGDPVAQTITGTVDISSGADDNVRVAVRTMKTTAVYWDISGLDDFGKPTYDDPVVIACRWDDVQEEFIGPNGDREMSKARLIVDRDLKVKGVVLLGTLDSITDQDEPKENDGAWEIRSFSKTANFKGTKYLREVYL